MRKIIFIVFLSVWMIMPAVSQVAFGVRVGGAYSSLVQKVEGTYKAGARFGFSVAGLADIPLYKGLSLRPEVAFANQGGSFISNFQVEGAKNSLNKCSYYSIQVPVNLAYTFNINDVQLGVYVGPALDFSLFGKMKTQNQNVDIHFGQDKETDLKTFDLGVNVGLRVDYSRYFFSVGALCGTLDRRAVEREGESSLYQNNVTLSLGYMFRSR
ncbi:PorT family protein [Parabacteroides acidifaciens]|uniref:PorT family protein n=1 Tax=Parabacteroides acidifaciens TaxID=2290935 RepID=A0A3D8HC23_9BACT|nr:MULTISPECIES: porin family protein [Parabacteroides]MBC8602782.1 PorT family protein [Parabacteroides acidifaciens]RDU48478.1 PorT family protein [Parabacteroides acidifaciens]RHO70405.1 PorT family protein [Parabacteroides sp. AF48-14]